MKRFDETTCVKYTKTSQINPVLDEENELDINIKVFKDRYISSKKMIIGTDVSQSSVLSIL